MNLDILKPKNGIEELSLPISKTVKRLLNKLKPNHKKP